MSRGARVSVIVVGLSFGFLLTGSRLGDPAVVHGGLALRDPYIFQMMGSAMAVAVVGLVALRRRGATVFGGALALPRRPVERRHVYGGAVFGLGFGIAGACPGTAIAMVATGGVGGIVVLAGMLGGLRLRGAVEATARRPAIVPSAAVQPEDRSSTAPMGRPGA